MTRDELIERMARAMFDLPGFYKGTAGKERWSWDNFSTTPHLDPCKFWLGNANAALSALCTALPGLSDVIDGKAVIVPMEPTSAMFTAGQRAVSRQDARCIKTVDWEQVYAAMINARPK